MPRKQKNGMTLVEVLVATLIFTISLIALLGSLTLLSDIIDIAKDKTTATSDLRNIMETIRATPFSSTIIKFPNGVVNGPAGNPYPVIVGNYSLRGENITVTYANPNTDPLELKVTTKWLDKKGHSFNASLSTFKTKQ